jgi:hypothetical protein
MDRKGNFTNRLSSSPFTTRRSPSFSWIGRETSLILGHPHLSQRGALCPPSLCSLHHGQVGKLHQSSVILTFHNEALSVLLRSVHSIMDRYGKFTNPLSSSPSTTRRSASSLALSNPSWTGRETSPILCHPHLPQRGALCPPQANAAPFIKVLRNLSCPTSTNELPTSAYYPVSLCQVPALPSEGDHPCR